MLGSKKNEISMFVYQSIDPVTARPIVHQACKSCRAKKVRCTYEKSGCHRCKSLSKPCVYGPTGAKGGGRKKAKTESSDASSTTSSNKKSKQADPPKQPEPTYPPSTDTTEPSWVALVGGPPGSDPDGLDALMGMPSMDFTMELSDSIRAIGTGDSSPSPLGVDAWPIGSPGRLSGPSDADMDMRLSHNHLADLNAFSTLEDAIAMSPLTTSPIMSIPPMGGGQLGTSLSGDTEVGSTLDGLQSSASQPETNLQASKAGSPLPAMASVDPRAISRSPDSAPLGSSLATSSPVHSSGEGCQCLKHVVFLLDELETDRDALTSQPIDSWLVSLKEALRYVETMLACVQCSTRPENMTILTFLADRLASSCERHVEVYLSLTNTKNAIPTSTAAAAAADANHNNHNNSSGNKSSAAGPNFPAPYIGCVSASGTAGPSGRWSFFFGDYEVDSPRETALLLEVLIVSQLRLLVSGMGRLKEVSGQIHVGALCKKAMAIEKRIEALLNKLVSVHIRFPGEKGLFGPHI